uniref:Uncharacterized protein n=1 Tax=Peronospora matthiolae TaxID=2874970 RepID=A0AAV1UAZ0_9STRA
MDSSDDWGRLREQDYAGDDLLKFCDPQRKAKLSQHLVCALVYDREIAALVEGVPADTRVSEKLRSHIHLLSTNALYRKAYYSSASVADWAAIERFFYSGLTRPAEIYLLQN